MPTYKIGDQTVQADGPLTDDDIDHIAQQSSTSTSIPGEAGKGFESSWAGIGQGFADLINKLHPPQADDPFMSQEKVDAANKLRTSAAGQYKQLMTANAPAVPTAAHIQSAHDAALWAANKIGGMGPYVASALLGGVPAMVSASAAQTGEQEAQQPDATPASIATAATTGGVAGAIPVPFLRGGGGIAARALKTLTGGGLYGAATGATADIPRAVATGNPEDAIPSSEGLIDSILGGAVGMGAFGAAHGGGKAAYDRLTSGSPASASTGPQDHANARLAQRISDSADQNGYDLKKVAYDAGDGSKATLDTVHNGLATNIKDLWGDIRDTLPDVNSVGDRLDQSDLNGIIKSAVNKLKGRVGDDDLQKLSDVVGHTEEGRVLVDLVRQSNSLTDLFNGGLKGGVSRYTDHLNPLTRGGPENGFGSVLARAGGSATRLAEMLAVYHNPTVAGPLAAGYGIGRGIDALTGRRSTVAKFVNDNSGPASPVDMSGTQGSILRQKAQVAASLNAARIQAEQAKALKKAQGQFDSQQSQADAARLQEREQQLRTHNRLDNNPGLGGFDKSIYDQTGIRPADAVPGVFELFRTGRITPGEFHGFFEKPRDLMAGNAGNHIIDMLDKMARDGQLQRDPEWKQTQASDNASAIPPQVGTTANRSAYEAQAAGNQARLTEAQSRVAASNHSSATKQAINDGISAIGRSNNRQDAAAVRDNLVQSLGHTPEAQATARQELDPLVKQIRHSTPEAASKRGQPLQTTATERDSRGRPISRERLNTSSTDRLVGEMDRAMPREGMSTDVARDGNQVSRLRAQLYKNKAGITKPSYDGAREPEEGYLKQVADFHDKAVHDPDNPAVARSYAALAKETIAQFKSLGSLKVETFSGDGEPYRNSKEMMRDVADNHHLWFLPTESAFGSGDDIPHPMLADTGLKTVDGHPLLVNDVFRIVHDYFGHTQHGFQFGPKGEYNAFREHAQMYSDAALPALASETLAQNAWVNFGPHLRRPDGSLPKSGDADYVAPPERRFSDQKAYAFPPELIARDPNLSREFIDHLYNHPQGQIPQGADVDFTGLKKLDLHNAIPGFKGIAQFLTPSELDGMIKRTAKLLVDKFDNLPSAAEMASVAYSGRAKKGWYRQSSKAIVSIFGAEDAPRFTALLAALSPQTSVESNLTNALNVWRGWIEADRPRDERSIMRIMGENVEGDKGPGSVLQAWVNNSVRALTAPDGEPITISGPKVSSFMQNLLGDVNEVTNDTWIANYAGIKQETFKGADRGVADEIGNVYGKGSGYLAMSALARKAADTLTKRTGETWTPAEVQETVWSWAKALSEKANSKQSATQLVKEQGLSHDEINSVPDFEKLFVSDTYARILDQAGYGDNIDNLKYTLEDRAANAGGSGPGGTPFSAEGSGVSQTALLRHLVGAAKRLDTLKSTSGDVPGRVDNAADIGKPDEVVRRMGEWMRRNKNVSASLEPGPDGVSINSVEAQPEGRGHGERFMKKITSIADAASTPLTLEVSGDPAHEPDSARLLKWYGRHGFEVTNSGHDGLMYMTSMRRAPKVSSSADIGLSPGEIVAARHDTADAAQKVADALSKVRPTRVLPQDGKFSVVLGPKPEVNYPTAPVPAMRAYMDPDGRQGAASFISGIETPDGTTRGLSDPEIRAVAKSISRLVEGGIPAQGQQGVYSEGNNTIRVYGGLSEAEHSRVLGHETGHAIEALANVVGILDRGNPQGDRRASDAAKTLDIVKELSEISRLERPHLWSNDNELERTFSRPAKYIHEYRTRLDELFADGIRHYMVDPAQTKKVAPNAARFIRDLVNPSKIGKVIAFAGLGGIALPGIIAQALSSLYSEGDKEVAA